MTPLKMLWSEIDHLLADYSDLNENIAKVRVRMSEITGVSEHSDHRLATEPQCGFLAQALATISSSNIVRLGKSLSQAKLHWETYNAYASETIGAHFLNRHAYTSLIAGLDPEWRWDFDLGFLLIAPNTFYRDHHHVAPELYLPLTGPSDWRFGTCSPWVQKQAGEVIWNPPNQIHAVLVHDVPLLCLYAWTEQVRVPAKVDFSKDWKDIEASL